MSVKIGQEAVQSILGQAVGNSNGVLSSSSYVDVQRQGQMLGQMSMWNDTEFMISVHKCKNGHLIRIGKSNGHIANMWVVPEGEDVAKAITTAIVAHKLEVK